MNVPDDRRQTDGREIAYSERDVSSRSLKAAKTVNGNESIIVCDSLSLRGKEWPSTIYEPVVKYSISRWDRLNMYLGSRSR